jgi:type II secretory pathway component PulF
MAFAVPRFVALFNDFGVALPAATILVIRASRQLVALVLLVLVLLVADWFLLSTRTDRGVTRVSGPWSVLMLACPLLLIALTLVALGVPLLGLLDRLNR